ncbi:MAG: hypothetical protein A3C93_02900 [Candidatus Lloydbacteria bacterium RIFCSPHIGHO2_02_FULL_54_17]|uniref:Uncharacterized protein n=1 Tax=Candidatus Lloydbacteria bacterium RIFCSPHIGHO2_02_FULL_54_17 TaxID=1798664 RepID=A0A1G2DAG1_9BACT|nr:MAG: hypothetical protein A2762_04770 [Candidatus Lloydbacteria bacterium RIFCSPHIGHO2_01_FULL_54_11]OGZ10619.1 MAG: hypothetical protein A3C93_02900 [Candidatus Lloydbacteria bacterium RIFCSPHIGHO2_02_FULL_54_17]OGZ13654.1 MAG: hypothetical protein A2948_03090 [Candidatus Lloydbacteria bacterium RIFCSPLOWO2_01_FULL_54_18]OGZ16092.1 MAG: hypothetical protein A3H76_01545 [Candidatus Lloydbacteria bacterium RIFCSPLOWO2_02_FULL_54_12]
MSDDKVSGGGGEPPKDDVLVPFEQFAQRMKDKVAAESASDTPASVAQKNLESVTELCALVISLGKAHLALTDIFEMQTNFIYKFASSRELREHEESFRPLFEAYKKALDECTTTTNK